MTEYSLPAGEEEPTGITMGSDGAQWFTDENSTGAEDFVGRITTAGSVTGEYEIPTSGGWSNGVTASPNGSLWFTEYSKAQVGRLGF